MSILAALAQENRLAIYRYLVQAGGEGVAAGRIGEDLGIQTATLSFHLKILKQAGLLCSRREGRSLIYCANYAVMNSLLAYLSENCCNGNPAQCRIPPRCECAVVPLIRVDQADK